MNFIEAAATGERIRPLDGAVPDYSFKKWQDWAYHPYCIQSGVWEIESDTRISLTRKQLDVAIRQVMNDEKAGFCHALKTIGNQFKSTEEFWNYLVQASKDEFVNKDAVE